MKSSLRIVMSYALFGVLWIILSDRLVGLLITDPQRIIAIETYKGLVYVLASALFLYFVVRIEFRARERAEARLKASEEKYRTLIETANDAIIVFDAASGTVIETNRKAEELVGLPAEKIIGMQQLDLHPKEEHERCRGIFREALTRGRMMVGTACLSHRDGRRIPTEVSISVLELGGKKVVQSIFRDVSERQEAEERLRHEKERAQMYLDVAGVMIVVIGADERVLLINRKGAQILGYAEDEIIGKNWFDTFIPARIRSELRAGFRRLLAGEVEPVEYFEISVVTRSGEERLIAWNNTFIRDESGKGIAALSSGEDITARRRAEDQARLRLDHLAALHAIDLMITSSLDLRVTLKQFVDLVISQFRVDAADVLLLNPHTQTLEYAAGHGFLSASVQQTRLRMGQGIAGLAALERRSIHIPNMLDPASGFVRAKLLRDEDFKSYYVVPLAAKGQVKGVLEVLHRAPLTFDAEELDYLTALAAQAAIAIDNATLFDELQRSNIELTIAYDATLEGWARALDLRDRVTERHTERVTEMTVRLARALGMSERELVHVRRGALLHDIGKIGIPDSILLKQGPLTPEEWEIMRRHPVYAFEMLKPIAYLRQALDIPYCHHERWDGTGYPRGLKGEQIPLAARVFSLADIWDALFAADRPYRRPLSVEDACTHIKGLAGTHLDPKVIEVFLSMKDEFCTFAPEAAEEAKSSQ